MKNANVKTSLIRKTTAIASAAMTLSTVLVFTMAPMSQAQAGQFGEAVSARQTKVAKGGGRSWNAATADARKKISCPWGTHVHEVFWNGIPWYNWTWFSMDIGYTCGR